MYNKFETSRTPFKPNPPRAQFKDKPWIPSRKVDDACVSHLLTIVQDGDYNKIKNYISEKNMTFNMTNSSGENIIHMILKSSFTDMDEDQKLERIKFFVDQGTSISTYNSHNVTPLHLAAKYQYPKIVEYLINKGVRINAVDNLNMNALHYAVQGNIVDCKPKKQVGRLISRDTSDEAVERHKKELKNLGASIIDLLNTQNLKNYVLHVKKLLNNLSNLYPQKMKEFRKKIQNTDASVKNQVARTIVKEINSFVDDKIKKVTTSIELSEDNIDILAGDNWSSMLKGKQDEIVELKKQRTTLSQEIVNVIKEINDTYIKINTITNAINLEHDHNKKTKMMEQLNKIKDNHKLLKSKRDKLLNDQQIINDNISKINNDINTLLKLLNNAKNNDWISDNVTQIDEESPTGRVLGDHLYTIKYKLINSIIRAYQQRSSPDLSNEPELKNDIKQIKQGLYKANREKTEVTDINKSIYIDVAKLADQIIMNMIQYSLLKGSTKVATNADKDVVIEKKPNADDMFEQQYGDVVPITDIDRGFSLNFNKLLDEITNKFAIEKVDKTANQDYDNLKDTSKLMKELPEEETQHEVMNTDYTQLKEITEKQCYDIKPSTIEALLRGRINPNQQDAALNTPIFYAIDTGFPEIIELLAPVSTDSKNRAGFTPLAYALNAYIKHGSGDNKNTMQNLYHYVHKNIENGIMANPDYANNIIKYMNSIFPQLIMMHNHTFSMMLSGYRRNWTTEDNSNLDQILSDYKILPFGELKTRDLPLLRGHTIQTGGGLLDLIKRNTNLGVLTDKLTDRSSKTKTIEDKKKEYQSRVAQYEKQIEDLVKISTGRPRTSEEQKTLTKLNQDIINLKRKINNLDTQVISSETQRKQMQENLDDRSKEVHTDIKDRIKKFKLTGVSVPKIYDKVINDVTKKDYNLYNEMWKDYIFSNKNLLMNRTNIHLAVTALQTKLATEIKTGNTSKVNDVFKVLNKLYKNILVPSIEDYRELPNKYGRSENYMLTDTVDSIIHINRYVIGSSLYLAVTKTLTKYLISVNPIKEKTDETNNEYIKDLVIKINSSSNYEDYAIRVLPKIAVKNLLKIYESEYDPDKQVSLDEAFTVLANKLINNGTVTITEDSSLIKNLKSSVFPYYKNLFEQFVPNMKLLVDNYNRYIINESKYIDMVSALLHRSSKNNNQNYKRCGQNIVDPKPTTTC